jgi:glycosyltransferase involved in cell wall biosynthesis
MHISNIRVLHVIARINAGGTARYLENLVPGLMDAGFEILIATGFVQESEIEDESVKYLPIVRVKHLGRRINIKDDLLSYFELRRIIQEFKPDLIHTHTFKAGLLIRSLPLDIPVIHTFHGHLLDDPEFFGLRQKILISIERRLARRTKVIITVGRKVLTDLVARGIGRLDQYKVIVPGLIETKTIEKGEARKQLGIDVGDQIVVVWAARMTHVKNPRMVLEIARELPEILFVMAGVGSLQPEIYREKTENVRLVGYQNSSILWASGDIALSTSFNEGIPYSLIEAQMHGLPIVASNVGSVSELVGAEGNQFLVSGRLLEYVDALKALISDKNILKNAGLISRDKFIKNNSIENFVVAQADVYSKALLR